MEGQQEQDPALVTRLEPHRRTEEEAAPAEKSGAEKSGAKPRLKTSKQFELARRRQMTYLQKRREQKKLKVLLNRLRTLLRMFCALGLIAGLVVLIRAPFWVYDAPRFEMSSTRFINPAQVAKVLRSYVGHPIYAINPAEIAGAIRQRYPVADEVHVRRYLFPTRLEVSIVEKKPWAVVYESPQAALPYSFVSGDYQIVPLAPYHHNPQAVVSYPLIRLILPNRPHATGYLKKLDTLVHQLRSVPGLHLETLDAAQPAMLFAQYREIGVRIGRLDQSTRTRLERLLMLAPRIPEFQGAVDRVDISWGGEVTLHKINPADNPGKSTEKDKPPVTGTQAASPTASLIAKPLPHRN